MSTLLENLDLDFRKALIVSVAFHLVLLGIFAVIRFGWMEQVPEWVEMSFVTARPAPGRPAPSKRIERSVVERPTRAEKTKETVEPEVKTAAEKPAVDEVIVPKRRMLEEEEPALPLRTSGKIAPKEKIGVVRPEASIGERPAEALPASRAGVGEKPEVLSPEVGVGAKELPKLSEDLGGGIPVPFEITGEVRERTILKKVVPQYPEGLQKEAVVRIRFTVLPNGLVGEMVPLLKSDPTLERISLEALRQWRFNPLDENDEQVTQQGIITFRYVLR
jgi:TonB family protein